MKNTIYLGLVFILLIISWSCSEEFLTQTPKDQLTTGNFYKTESDFTIAVNSVYGSLEFPRQSKELFPMLEMVTPMAVNGGGRFGMFDWGQFGLNANYRMSNEWWPTYWRCIYKANVILEKAAGSDLNIKDFDIFDRVKGETYFLRALNYFYLTYLWGDVPLITEVPNSLEEVYPTNATHAEIVEQIISDLKQAEILLPSVTEYRLQPSLLGRASKGAAVSLLGKLYCFEQRWQEAATELKKVIDSGDYQLNQDSAGFINMFWPAGKNGNESIFELQYNTGIYSESPEFRSNGYVGYCARGNTGIETQGAGFNYNEPTDYCVDMYETKNGYKVQSHWQGVDTLTADIWTFTSDDPAFDPLQPFENRDPRLQWTVLYEGSPYLAKSFPGNTFTAGKGGTSNYATVKYIVPQTRSFDSPGNITILRYADVLLLYAEALNELGSSGQAATYVNMVRQRNSVQMPVVPTTIASDQASLRNYIREERMRELAFEYGHVYFDMVRWRTLGPELIKYWTANKFGRTNPAIQWDDKYYLWAIPQAELDRNKNLKQNPLYAQ